MFLHVAAPELYSYSHIDRYMTIDKFHVFPDMMKELAEKQFCCGVILVVEELLDKQEESVYITGIQSLQFQG